MNWITKNRGRLKVVILLVTYDCNLRCSYCYEPKTAHGKMSFDMARSIIQRTIDTLDSSFDGIIIQFMGGEPLLQFDLIKDICEWVWSLDLKIDISNIHSPTNGTLLKQDMKEWLVANKERFCLALSFDGNRLMQNMNRSNSAPMVDMKFFAETYPFAPVKMTLSPQTISYFFEGYKFLIEQGFKVVEPSLAMGDSVGWRKEHLIILKNELAKLVEYLADNPEIIRAGDLNLPIFDVLKKDSEDRSCQLGPGISCYDCNGKAYPCHLFSPIALSQEMSDKSVTFDFDDVRSAPSLCKRCLLKNICARCFAINYRDRGDCTLTSAFDCAQYKLFFYANCRLERMLAQKNGDTDTIKLIDHIISLMYKNSNAYDNA